MADFSKIIGDFMCEIISLLKKWFLNLFVDTLLSLFLTKEGLFMERFRRTRLNSHLRSLVRETHVSVNDFIYPLFVRPGEGIKTEVSSMPGVFQMSLDEILKECELLQSLGIYSIILFGIPEVKDSIGSDALCDHGIIATAVRAIKRAYPKMFVVTDLCFCEYTDHGHCGILDHVHETVDNDLTLGISAQQALDTCKSGGRYDRTIRDDGWDHYDTA